MAREIGAVTSLYRVEDHNRIGPYIPGTRISTGENHYRIHARNDNLVPTDPREIFVFRNLDLLRAWFTPDAHTLMLLGYQIVTFTADPQKIRDGLSGRQSVYLDTEPALRTRLTYEEVFGNG